MALRATLCTCMRSWHPTLPPVRVDELQLRLRMNGRFSVGGAITLQHGIDGSIARICGVPTTLVLSPFRLISRLRLAADRAAERSTNGLH